MYKILNADKDCYIVDRYVNGVSTQRSNTGGAGSIDLYKLSAGSVTTFSTGSELTRGLVHFDLQPLKDAASAGTVDFTNPSFNCTLVLKDVYGGQPTPSNFTLDVYPLSASFDEGLGRDVVMYTDLDTCNFLSGSRTSGAWFVSGCNGGNSPTVACDFVNTFKSSQAFAVGTEDMAVDVTQIVSATLAGVVPDQGFRVSFTQTQENNDKTYFVKRFASRQAHNEDKRPQLVVKFDDSVQDDSQTAYLDAPTTLFMYNNVGSGYSNVVSSSVQITGSNCMSLRLVKDMYSGTISYSFAASQYSVGSKFVAGVYSSSVLIPTSDPHVVADLAVSGSLKFTPIWRSLDNTVGYLTGSAVEFFPPQRGSKQTATKKLTVNAYGLQDEYSQGDMQVTRVNIFDRTSPLVKVVKVPIELPGIVVRDVFYQVTDTATQEPRIPFDTVHNSTRCSSDSTGMFFTLDTANLVKGRTYVIDIMVKNNGGTSVYRNASNVFRVV